MGLLLVEMVATSGKSLDKLVSELLDEVGPSHYARLDQRLNRPIAKPEMVRRLEGSAPDQIGGVAVREINTMDGVKYQLEDHSWLLIRPSGTEPVLRIYAEATNPEHLEGLLEHGRAAAAV